MKSLPFIQLAVASILLTVSAHAAPIESVESGRARAALPAADMVVLEQTVAHQLQVLGLSAAQVEMQLAELSDAQIEELAGAIDRLQAGGTIEGGNPHPWGFLGCIFRPIGRLLHDIYQVLFCWGSISTD